ncbi:MAG: efflux RND transporter periplasmic adaptor subunit [Deltaproteobacteria bacterium]|nr:efflux RND transporter periplasmic adaptor subunit [Deltaproteobacteria bacterium]
MRNSLLTPRRLAAGAAIVVPAAAALFAIFGTSHGAATSGGPGGGGPGVVRKQDLVQRVTVAGTVIPNKRTLFMPPYAGYIKKIYVKVGDKVRAGDPIISVVQSLNMVGEIYPMRAPFTGSVVQVLKTEGEWVETTGDNNVLLRIDDTSQLFVAGDAPEIDMVKIKVGQEVVIRAAAVLSRSYKGIVREISLAAREKKDWYRANEKVEFPIRIEVADQDERLKPGMSTLVDIIAAKATQALTLPHEYIEKNGEKYYVTPEKGARREITVGLQNEEMFEITKGVTEGERVKAVDFTALPAAPETM